MLFKRKKRLATMTLSILLSCSISYTMVSAATVEKINKPIPKISSSGDNFSFLDEDGQAWLLGERKPTKIPGMNHVVDISHGGDIYTVKDDGSVWMYARDYEAENTWYFSITKPIQLPVLKNITKVSTDNAYSAALDRDGRVWVWNSTKLGQPKLAFDAKIQAVPDLKKIVDIQVTVGTLIALKEDGTVLQGKYNYGMDWNELQGAEVRFHQVPNLTHVAKLGTGQGRHHLVIKEDGTVWGWGPNGDGALTGSLDEGQETYSTTLGYLGKQVPEPIQIQGLSKIKEVSSGAYHNLALSEDGTVWQWGGIHINIFQGFDKPVRPTPFQAISDVQTIWAAQDYSVAMKKDGTLWTWGKMRRWGASLNFETGLHDGQLPVEVPYRS
ncbi:hypothetical protein WMW72_26340 [Paenibacillus filicis]|uniref:Uncharacterized protein n=1 Tax=Paenibacillus filicis TaxID=669464 RepID=A0ABU9DTM4_9BACL